MEMPLPSRGAYARVSPMKRYLLIALVIAPAILLSSCRKEDVRTVVIEVPAMKNQACADRVVNALAEELAAGPTDDVTRQRVHAVIASGVISTDIERRTATVVYDSLKLALKNLEFAVAKAGFDANNTPAEPQAAKALPPECR